MASLGDSDDEIKRFDGDTQPLSDISDSETQNFDDLFPPSSSSGNYSQSYCFLIFVSLDVFLPKF